MCLQSAIVCLIKSPALDGAAGLSLVERLRLLPDPRRAPRGTSPVRGSVADRCLGGDCWRALVGRHRQQAGYEDRARSGPPGRRAKGSRADSTVQAALPCDAAAVDMAGA